MFVNYINTTGVTSGAGTATIPEHLSSLPVFSGVRVTRSLVLYVCFVDRCLSFCTFSFGHCVVCSSSIYGFWSPFGIFKLFLNHLAFRCFDYERIWWALFQKRVGCAYKVFFDFIIIDSNQDLNLRLISLMYWKSYPILVINWNQDYLLHKRDRRGRDRMVVWHSVRITTNVVSSNPGVLVPTLCDKFVRLMVFSR